MGAYKDSLQICESDNCAVRLRGGEILYGHMRKWYRYAAPTLDKGLGQEPLFTWVLIPRAQDADPQMRGKKTQHHRTYNSNGNYSIHSHIVSQFDMIEFQIGNPPKG